MTVYFALAFSAPGCIPHGEPTPYAVDTRRELVAAVRDQFYNDSPSERRAMAYLGVRELWGWAKRHGLSTVFRELPTAHDGEVLCLMGMTRAEYEAASERN